MRNLRQIKEARQGSRRWGSEVHICNPSTERLIQEASLGHIEDPVSETKQKIRQAKDLFLGNQHLD
jgi:hypothetical protein